ncbi:MAG: ATP-binding protein [Thermodesulfobacteriota bacterium]
MRKKPTIEQELRKRRRELAVALVGALVIGVIFYVESEVVRSAEDIPVGGHIFLFGLLSVVTLLLILIIYFLIRNVFKLIFERRQKVLGSNLKTRLTLAFVVLTLVPTVILFIASAGMVHTTIESWFKAQVEESLQSALVVEEAYYQTAKERAGNTATSLASIMATSAPQGLGARDEMLRAIRYWRAAEGLSSLQIHFPDHSPPLLAKDPELERVTIPDVRASLLRIAFKGEKTTIIEPLEPGSRLVRAITPIKAQDGAVVEAALVTDHYIPSSLAGRMQAISAAFDAFQEAKRMRGPVKSVYVLMLLMVSLLVIFIGFWFGMTMARDITDPIQELAEATGRIAGGDLDVHLEPQADDELGVLVRSFNKMTADLRTSRDDLVRLNQDLESRRKYMETVLANVASGVVAVDPEGNVTTANKSAARLLGVGEEALLGLPLGESLPEAAQEPFSQVLEDLSQTGTGFLDRQLTLPFPGRTVSLICHAGSLQDDEGRDLGVVLVFEDMTQLLKAQRMAAWREVARRIAHEIKNPLTPIQLNAQRVRRKYLDRLGHDGEVLNQCTRTIIDQVEVLKKMVNEFSKFARMPAANPIPGDLNSMVRDVVNLYSHGNEGTAFVFEPDPSVPVLDLDQEQMKRALINLLDNAGSSAGKGGRVLVSTEYDPVLSIATLEVGDNGAGIDPAHKDLLFEPYFTTKKGGSGLGLTIVNSIVADHNGFVRVKDDLGGGARFIIELPVKSPPQGRRA